MVNILMQYLLQHPLLFHSIIILASLGVIVKAADYLVMGITNYSKKHGLSDYITGMIVVAMAASIPELVSSIMGTVADEPGIVFGTIIGSNLSGIALVYGIFALIGGKINLKSKVLEKTEVIIFIFSVVPFLLVADGVLSRIDGVVLVLLYVAFTAMLWRKEGELGKLKKQIKLKNVWKDALLFLLALTAIFLSSRWLVYSSISASELMGISPYYISLIIIGIGTTIPDLTVGIRSVLQGHQDVGIGDSLGSMILKSLLFLGVIAILSPLAIDFSVLLVAIVFTLVIRGVTFYFTEKGYMNWKHGLFMLLLFIAFVIVESLKGGIR